MNVRSFLVLLALAVPLYASANQADRRQSELDALKQRLKTLQQEFRTTQAHRKEAVDELRQSELAISSAVRQMRQLDSERQRTQGELQTLKQQAEAAAARISEQQSHLAQALKGAYQRGQGDALKLILNGGDPNQAGLPEWPAVRDSHGGITRQTIDADTRTEIDRGAARQAFLRDFLASHRNPL